MKDIGLVILGGTGYGASELLRFIYNHPYCELVSIVSSSASGTKLEQSHPHLDRLFDGTKFTSEVDWKKLATYKHKVIITSLPHGTSGTSILKIIAESPTSDLKIIDLSGDLRLSNQTERQRHYPESPPYDSFKEPFVYGLTELNREKIRGAKYVANPGCLATTCILSVAPLVMHNFKGKIFFDAKTGTSGAGRNPSPQFHHPAVHGGLTAYKVLEHRHEPEILEGLRDPSGQRITTAFVPHVIPLARGIYVTAFFDIDEELSTDEVLGRYREFYKDAPFIRVRADMPNIASVVGSNFCDLSVKVRERTVVAIAATDNLVKGMVGQALQNMNLMCELPETSGINLAPLGIV